VIVLPGVLSLARDYASFADALAARFTVHTMERRGRGESGPQGEDYSIAKECEDVLALRGTTGASLLVGHSYGGLVALEVARSNAAFTRVAVYEPGVSIDGSMAPDWLPAYEKCLAEGNRLEALARFTLGVGPDRLRRMPRRLMELALRIVVRPRDRRQWLGLLEQTAREWREIARLDNTSDNYREVTAEVLYLYGGKSDSRAVTVAVERVTASLPRSDVREFERLDHFGIERKAPVEVAGVIGDFLAK
jgi:pimeloyl-ACP methyl ester carboxylesterase